MEKVDVLNSMAAKIMTRSKSKVLKKVKITVLKSEDVVLMEDLTNFIQVMLTRNFKRII